jgi:hypothetical protein
MLPEQHAVSLARQKLKIPRLPVLTVLLYPTDHSPPVPLRIKLYAAVFFLHCTGAYLLAVAYKYSTN